MAAQFPPPWFGFPNYPKQSKEQLIHWELLGDGEGVHWPEIDEPECPGLLTGTH